MGLWRSGSGSNRRVRALQARAFPAWRPDPMPADGYPSMNHSQRMVTAASPSNSCTGYIRHPLGLPIADFAPRCPRASPEFPRVSEPHPRPVDAAAGNLTAHFLRSGADVLAPVGFTPFP